MNPHEDLLYKIALTKVPKVGAVIARNLISHCGGVRAIFETRRSTLLKVPGVGRVLADAISRKDVLDQAAEELLLVEKNALDVHFYLDQAYPGRLQPFSHSPILLYAKGNLNLNPAKAIAIVGTRSPTDYGKQKCAEIVRDLKSYGVTIVSGLAYGIDICAHRAAIAEGLPTIAVMGSGFGSVYPAVHRKTAARMTECGGLITEYDYHTSPDKENFPARNRIVAAMVDAVIVIESARTGGSMITAEFANGCNKDVFALPGRSGDLMSEGCNELIKAQKAHLLDRAVDLVELLRWDSVQPKHKSVQRQMFADLSDSERLVVELVDGSEGVGIDVLAYESKISLSELSTVLLSLEFKGIIRSLPGKRYRIV